MGGYRFTFIADDLSLNSFGRVYILAQAASRLGSVEIIGATSNHGGQKVWPVLDTSDIKVKAFPSPRSSRQAEAVYEQMAKDIHGNILYACKARLMSYGFGLWYRKRSSIPLLLDYDDDEKAFVQYQGSGIRKSLCGLKDSLTGNPKRRGVLQRLETRIHEADGLTVCSRVFQRRLGGTIIPHGRDEQHFDPSLYDSERLKNELGFERKKIILFLGTPQPHKGLQDLVQAFSQLNADDVMLLLIGVDSKAPPDYLDITSPNINSMKGCSWSDLPKYLTLADLVVIPQRQHQISEGQMPAKLTDAMAMNTVVLASSISDIPEYLDGRGYTFEPGNVDDLRKQIQHILEHPDEAVQYAMNARKYFLDNLTYDSMAEGLRSLIEPLAAKFSI